MVTLTTTTCRGARGHKLATRNYDVSTTSTTTKERQDKCQTTRLSGMSIGEKGEGPMANRRCEALKGDGSRCQARALEGSNWCYGHDPSRAEERSANARRGGRAGGRGRGGLDDTQQAIKHTKSLVARLLSGDVQREAATAAFMGLHVLARYIELERKIHAEDELEARIAVLERRQRVEQNVWQARHRRS
jgi:hypothetical protein